MDTPYFEVTITKTYHYRDDYNYDKSKDSEYTYVSLTREGMHQVLARALIEHTPHPEDADTTKENYTTISVGNIRLIAEEFEADMALVTAEPDYIDWQADLAREMEEEAREDAARAARAAARVEENERAQLAELIAKHGIPEGVTP